MPHPSTTARFALSSAGVAAAAVASPAIANDIVITLHLDYWAGEHGMSFTGPCGGIASFVADGYIYAVSSGSAQIYGTSIESWNSGVSPYTSGYRWTIHASLDGGTYDVLLTDSYGDGWAWNNVTGADAFRVYGSCTFGDTSISFSSGSSRTGRVQHCLGLVGCGGSDCNNNGIDDAEDIYSGDSADCNRNGVPDECDLEVVAIVESASVPTSTSPLTIETIDLPAVGGGDVRVQVAASAELGATAEYLVLAFDGAIIDFLGDSGGIDCTNQAWSFDISATEWDAAGADGTRTVSVYASPAVDPTACASNAFSIEVTYLQGPEDCNDNGAWDACDINDGDATDLDGDGVPDDCQVDCDADGVPDDWAVSQGLAPDCNTNGIPDACDIATGVSNDVDDNGVPDECKADCNENGLPDAYEIAIGSVADCDLDGVPDPCTIDDGTVGDCDSNGIPDSCQIDDGSSFDCNGNGVPDACDLSSGDSADVDGDGVPDDCQPDCNDNGLPDAYEIAEGLVADCNANLAPDSCDIASGEEADDNANAIPDSCDLARGDLDLDGCIGPADLGFMLALWGVSNPPTGDLDGDGTIGPTDLGIMLANWGCDG